MPTSMHSAPKTVTRMVLLALATSLSARKKPTSRQLQKAVISQKMYIHSMLAEKTSPIMEPRKSTTIV